MLIKHIVVESHDAVNFILYMESLKDKRTNVRSRVRYWLNDIVDEMRKKSPASVQKWVDSIQIPVGGGASGEGEPGPSLVELAPAPDHLSTAFDSSFAIQPTSSAEAKLDDPAVGDDPPRSTNDLAPQQSDQSASTSDEDCARPEEPKAADALEGGSTMGLKNLLSKRAILEKLSRSSNNLEQDNPEHVAAEADRTDEDCRKGASLASIGKIKINEFYDKLSMNKAKYSLIKSKKLDLRNMLSGNAEIFGAQSQHRPENLAAEESETEESKEELVLAVSSAESDECKIQESELKEPTGKICASDIYEFSFDESFPKDEEIPDVSEDEEKENVEMPLEVYDNHLNLPKTYNRMGIGKIGRSSSENPRANKRFNLMEIGRSFSEMNDDDNFVINECNNSCPNPSSLNTSSSINNSSSNILARSVPVSPIPRTSSKLSIQQENFLSESPRRRSAMLMKDSSLQSDSSRCSSVESLLNARKPDPERILLNLGFGPAPHSTDVLSKIPKRFLKPSQVRGVDTEAFLRQQQLSMHIHENSVLGYRGLVGNPHIPPSMIVAKIMERFQESERGRFERKASNAARMSTSAPSGQTNNDSFGQQPFAIPIPQRPSLIPGENVKFRS